MSYGKRYVMGRLYWNDALNMLDAELENGYNLCGLELGRNFDIFIKGYWVNTYLVERGGILMFANIGAVGNSCLGAIIRVAI